MAGTYSNTIKELMWQTKVNMHLLNDVNNRFHEHENMNFDDLRQTHLDKVNDVYARSNITPPYMYFDGTNYINSLFSFIVIPVEFIKGRFFKKGEHNAYSSMDDLLKTANLEAYMNCKEILGHIAMVNTYSERSDNLYAFMTHLRDALCHSGNGQLHFFPYGEDVDITHLYFYDEKYDKRKNKRSIFVAKIDLFDELMPLVENFGKIIESLSNNQPHYDFDSLCERVRTFAGRPMP